MKSISLTLVLVLVLFFMFMSQPMAKDLGQKVSRYQDNTTIDGRLELTSEGFADR
jgi:hypothetical protein